jgi:hypothetical protein
LANINHGSLFEVDEETGKAPICDNVFCQFPDAISYGDYDCINEGLFTSERSVFFNDVDMTKLWKSQMPMPTYQMNTISRISVADRERLRSNDHIPPVFVQLVMSWLQGDLTNKLWNKLTFIPIHVVQKAYAMQNLLHAYMVSIAEWDDLKRKQNERAVAPSPGNGSDIESDIEMDESDFQVLFHDVLDHARFMDCAEVVYEFVNSHRDMFEKPYFLQIYREVDKSWACQVAVNAGQMDDKDQPIKDEFVRGFFSFEPYASVQDPHDPYLCLAASLLPNNPFLSILTFAFNLLRQDTDPNIDESLFENVFPSIKDFAAFFDNMTFVFGPSVDSEDGRDFFLVMRALCCFRYRKTTPYKLPNRIQACWSSQASCVCCSWLIFVLWLRRIQIF